MKTKDGTKISLLRWKGTLGNLERNIRIMFGIELAVASATLTFTQLGFAGLGILGAGFDAYIVVLLLPIAIAALLLGTIWGATIGLFSGIVLLAHSVVMPLDYYELMFVTPVTSVVMFTVSGFLLGLLFALALRNNPSGVRRSIYIILVCGFVSSLYSLGFFANSIGEMILDIAHDYASSDAARANIDAIRSTTVLTVFRMGNILEQLIIDAILMSLASILADIAGRKAMLLKNAPGGMGLRARFAVWLAYVVTIVFMVTAATSFVAISMGERASAEAQMRKEAAYFCEQLDAADRRSMSFVEFAEAILDGKGLSELDVPEKDFDKLAQALTIDDLFTGYTVEENGIFCITEVFDESVFEELNLGHIILLSDAEFLPTGESLEDHMSDDVLKAIDESAETDRVIRIVYDDVSKIKKTMQEGDPDSVSDLTSDEASLDTQLAYLYSRSTESDTVTIIRPASMVFAGRGGTMFSTTMTALVLLLAVFLLTFKLLDVMVARRINETNDVLARIGQGDLDAQVQVHDTKEFDSLSTGINSTVDALKGWIAEAETRMDAELTTAKTIQETALPTIFPPFPDIMRFDVYATMNAAREVGGDFYDFFLIGDNADANAGKLGFVIADVSGKGVPAALFMMKAKTLIRDYMVSGMELGEAIENVNRQLCAGNSAGMFVTAWVGVLDYITGHVDFVNAGHNPPLVWQTDSWTWIKERSGLPLGLFEGLPYKAYSMDCQIGDQFLLYTDGVTEAMDVNNQLYGEDRLEEIAQQNYMQHPRKLVGAVRRDVARHAMGAEQSDDITILALEVGVPPEVTATLTVPALVDELPRVTKFIHTELDRRLCPSRAQNQLDIAVEELFVNVAHYAYPDATPDNPGTVHVNYTYSAEPPSITVDIMDDGIPYDPLAKPDAVTPTDIMDVPIGGLGILMAKRSVNEMRYERVDGSNVVTIVKKW